jgi:hypothetical protein
MSTIAMPPVRRGNESSVSASPAAPAAVEFRFAQTDSFVELLHRLGASLLVSTYQANKLLAVRASGRGRSTLVRTFDRPMGLPVDGGRLALGTRKEVWFLRNAPDIARRSSTKKPSNSTTDGVNPGAGPVPRNLGLMRGRSSHLNGDLASIAINSNPLATG